MQDYRKSNKISSNLWIKSAINRFSFRITLKPREGAVKFPKYHENDSNIRQIENENATREYTFKWHEKVFSQWEYNRYSEPNNCILECEKDYNLRIQNNDYKVSQMFTYLDNERQDFQPEAGIKNDEPTFIQRLNGRLTKDVSTSTKHLFKSELNINSSDDRQIMHIVWDNSVYNEDSQLLFKEECVLLSLHYHPTTGLLLTPRENHLEYQPYDVHTAAGVLGFQYAVRVVEERNDEEELVALLNKLNCKLDKKQKAVLPFLAPPRGRRAAVIHLEILTAADLEHDCVYIQYTLVTPDEVVCTGDTRGRTHVSEYAPGSRQWNYGHPVDLELEYDSGTEPPPITIYFEAISVDWWGRHRTEGYAYTKLTLQPGTHEETLSCRRPEELDKREAERRRFFIGECHLIPDLRVLDHPQDYDANFRYVTTGDITIRWHIITQAHGPGSSSSAPTSSASRLLQGAEDALQQYSKAKATLASATEDLDAIYGSGDR